MRWIDFNNTSAHFTAVFTPPYFNTLNLDNSEIVGYDLSIQSKASQWQIKR
jgi:hypothetical protein